MLVIGGFLGGIVEFLVCCGVDYIICLCILVVFEGIENFCKFVRDFDVFCYFIVVGLDDYFDEYGYIVFGLGDVGDCLYGLVE